jgi:hypothetical protein
MGKNYRNSSACFIFAVGVALAPSLAFAQSPSGPKGPLNNPKEEMVVPKPPTEGTSGQPNAKDIPGAGAQTSPSTVSAENFEKDKHWWLDRSIGLTPDQKRAIYSSISTKLDTEGASKIKIFGVLSEVLPAEFAAQTLPADITSKMPNISDLKYVKIKDQVLLINPGNNTVAAIIPK